MCYGGKCLHCITLEIGCLILGYFQAVVFGVIALTFIGLDAGSCQMFTPNYYCFVWNTKVMPMSVMFFVFSALLIYGVHNKISSFIMSYFAFGVVTLAMSVVYFIAMTVNGNLAAIAGLLIGVVYSHLLAMVYQTAKKIDLGNVDTDQHSLAGPSTCRPMNPPPYGKRGDGDVLEV